MTVNIVVANSFARMAVGAAKRELFIRLFLLRIHRARLEQQMLTLAGSIHRRTGRRTGGARTATKNAKMIFVFSA
jgi:hypothetical protein